MKKSTIEKIKAREILDSRGKWTLEVDLFTQDGLFRSAVPSGASTGKREAAALPALEAAENVNKKIAPRLEGKDPLLQKEIDAEMIEMDGTQNKSNLGANAILGVSLALARAGAASCKLPLWKYIGSNFDFKASLPKPSFNVINGGAHASNDLDFQEFMIVPQEKSFKESLKRASEIYWQLRKKLGANVGDEGGFAPPFKSPEEALDLVSAEGVGVILDVAASQFFKEGKYETNFGKFDFQGLLDYYSELVEKYPIEAIEDPFAEDDWEGFERITQVLGEKITVIGDDLLTTNPEKIKEASRKKACNGLLLKVNQIGTLSEALEAASLAGNSGWKVMVSHRSGETCDDFIADLAVGIGADYIKSGAPARGERTAKYNRLLRIEEEFKS